VNDDNNRLHLPIHFSMQDGSKLAGELVVNLGGAIDRTLNNDAKFILIVDEEGSERLIAKSAILEVRDAKKSRARPPSPVQSELSADRTRPPVQATDPYTTLGLVQTATDEEIRAAFIERAQAYNPDRLAAMGLPDEVITFCNTRYEAIGQAYSKLSEGKIPALAQQPTALAS
jgi:DnaJ-domain-containing protein 1